MNRPSKPILSVPGLACATVMLPFSLAAITYPQVMLIAANLWVVFSLIATAVGVLERLTKSDWITIRNFLMSKTTILISALALGVCLFFLSYHGLISQTAFDNGIMVNETIYVIYVIIYTLERNKENPTEKKGVPQ